MFVFYELMGDWCTRHEWLDGEYEPDAADTCVTDKVGIPHIHKKDTDNSIFITKDGDIGIKLFSIARATGRYFPVYI